MNATFTKTRDAQPMGQYKPTAVDAAKATAEFRIVDVSCRLKRIVWHNGRQQDPRHPSSPAPDRAGRSTQDSGHALRGQQVHTCPGQG